MSTDFRAFLLEQSHGYRPVQPTGIPPVTVRQFVHAIGPAAVIGLALYAAIFVLFV